LLNKLYAEKMELVARHWSGKHGRIVQCINLITLLTFGEALRPKPLTRLKRNLQKISSHESCHQA
jgi:hypothetical protein